MLLSGSYVFRRSILGSLKFLMMLQFIFQPILSSSACLSVTRRNVHCGSQTLCCCWDIAQRGRVCRIPEEPSRRLAAGQILLFLLSFYDYLSCEARIDAVRKPLSTVPAVDRPYHRAEKDKLRSNSFNTCSNIPTARVVFVKKRWNDEIFQPIAAGFAAEMVSIRRTINLICLSS